MVNYIDEALKEITPFIGKPQKKVKPKSSIPNGKMPRPKTSNEVQEIQNILRTMSIQSTFNHNPKRKEDMTYLQAIKRGHKLPAMKSSDGDIMPNIIDCRPFNKKKQTDLYDEYEEDEEIMAIREQCDREAREEALSCMEDARREEQEKKNEK